MKKGTFSITFISCRMNQNQRVSISGSSTLIYSGFINVLENMTVGTRRINIFFSYNNPSSPSIHSAPELRGQKPAHLTIQKESVIMVQSFYLTVVLTYRSRPCIFCGKHKARLACTYVQADLTLHSPLPNYLCLSNQTYPMK